MSYLVCTHASLTSCNVFNYLTVKTTTKTITKVSNKYIINT